MSRCLLVCVLFAVVGVLLLLPGCECSNAVISLWPEPSQSVLGESTVSISRDTFAITLHPSSPPSALLSRAIARYQSLVFSAALPTDPPSSSAAAAPVGALSTLQVLVLSSDEDLRFGVDESYNLTVTGDSGFLSAHTVFGAIYGLETFTQLVLKYRGGAGGYVVAAVPLSIVDRPRFGWRGILIDTARHYYPVDFILHTIDALAANKMNVFQ